MKKLTMLLLALCALPGYAAEITARVTGFANDQGSVKFAMFSKSRQGFFPDKAGQADYVADSVISAGTATITFHNVPEGEYAVFVYHDSNSNNILDHRWYGPPLEPFAYYRAFKVKLMPPAFDEVAFQVTDRDRVLDISLQTF